jgi:aminopeptidase N
MLRLLPLALTLALVASPSAGAAAPADTPVATLAPTQLPRGVRPLHYDVALAPHAEAMRFDGRVAVTLEVIEPTTTLTLNALDLAFTSVRLVHVGARAGVAPLSIGVDAGTQTATFTFARTIAAGRYRLLMSYSGVVGKQPIGLFAIDYDSGPRRARALYTQFENADARRVIPSWDEPAYKATFTLEATVPAAQMALSNMPAAATRSAGQGLKRIRFATSPTMSTYLLFFAVGDFERLTTRQGATEVGVVTRRGISAQARFALESSRDLLREYDDYFAVPYPLPKLDNVASPGASPFFGAMENWGAIFSFERGMLIDPMLSTQSDRQQVFENAAHEIAHQWFGNLVTMRWWDDVWLNEGFATWMEKRTTLKLHPEWDTALGAVESRGNAMAADAFATTHPIVQPIATVDEANQVFDSITYDKSAAVIAMLESYVGADAWREGVRGYIRAHAYGNTVSDDLWRAIEAASARPVGAIARDFTRQPGVPLLRVAAVRCDAGRTTLELEQGEFSLDHGDKAALRWQLPVIARVAGQPAARTVVANGQATLVVPGCGAVIVNAGQTGYYRTAYPPAQQAALRAAFASLNPIDQLGLLDDAWALGLAGAAPLADALELAAHVPDDADPKIWAGLADQLRSLDAFYRIDAVRQAAWRRYAIGRLAPILARVGWSAGASERASTTVLRARLIGTLGALDDASTVAEARRRYAARATDRDAVPTALRKTILAVVAGHADVATWNALRAQAQAEKSPLVKDQLYQWLARGDDAALAQRALELSISDEPGATNGAAMMSAVAEKHPDLAFDFAAAHREAVEKMVTAASANVYFPRLAADSLDPAMPGKLTAFAETHFAAESRRKVESAAAKVRYRASVARERLPAVDDWLRTRPQ